MEGVLHAGCALLMDLLCAGRVCPCSCLRAKKTKDEEIKELGNDWHCSVLDGVEFGFGFMLDLEGIHGD